MTKTDPSAKWGAEIIHELENDFRGYRTVEQREKQAVKMALIGPDGPTGTFIDEDGAVPWKFSVNGFDRASGVPAAERQRPSPALAAGTI